MNESSEIVNFVIIIMIRRQWWRQQKPENTPQRLKKGQFSINSKQQPKKLHLKVDKMDGDADKNFHALEIEH